MDGVVHEFGHFEKLLSGLDVKEQAMFKSIWILRHDIESLRTVISEDEATAVQCLLKLCLSSTCALQVQLYALCAQICRNISTFAKKVAGTEEVWYLAQPNEACVDETLPIVPYILALNHDFVAQACVFASHLNLVLAESLERNECTQQTQQAIQHLWILIRNKKVRQYFRTISGIQNILKAITNFCLENQASCSQIMYECLCICWVSLYEVEGAYVAYQNRIIGITHAVLKKSSKEKCIRVCLQILETLLWQYSRDHSLEAKLASKLSYNPTGARLRPYIDMASSGMLKTYKALLKKNWEDLDIPEKLKTLEAVLLSKVETMTSFAEYRGELQSGYLEWTPIHTNVKFWKENLKNFEANEFEILGFLLDILQSSTDYTSIAVACHDIGQIVRFHPYGRKLLTLPVLLGAREKIVALMQHSSPEVRRHALLAIQKIMVQKWEFIG